MMKNAKVAAVCGAVCLGLAGCATVPDMSELQRVDPTGFETEFVGNTITHTADYGRWAEYLASDSTSFGRASGSWGSEDAMGTYDVSEDGEACWTYSGSHEWSTPEHRFCSVFYTDGAGAYYTEVTVDTWESDRVGKRRSVEIKPGDAYGLSSAQ